MRIRYAVITALVGLLVGLATGPLAAVDRTSEQKAAEAAQAQQQLAEERELLRLFADTLEQVRTNYVDQNISERELIEAAIRGMLTRLDPYSNYIPPQNMDLFTRSVEQQYGGVGIRVETQGDEIVIVSPLYNSPAHRAGLKAGDRLIKIGNASTEGMSLDDAVDLMKGELGSRVALTVVHPGSEEPQTVSVQRELIRMETVMGSRRQPDGEWDYFCDPQQKIAYVRVTTFSKGTTDQLAAVLKQLLAAGMRGLILDLRYNPGGLLREAVQMADLFVRDGPITRTEVRNVPPETWSAHGPGTLVPGGFPVVVLVNRMSASASEIVSACLQDHHVAVVVGERTWGKASVQNIIEMERGKSALKLTTGSYQRPSGKNIHRIPGDTSDDGWGVQPDEGHRLRMTREELRALEEHFRRMDILAGGTDPAAVTPYTDRQQDDALTYLRGRLESDSPAVPEPAAASRPAVAAGAESRDQPPPNQPAGAPQDPATRPPGA